MLLYSRLIIIWEQHVEQIPWLAKKSVLATHSSARICAVKEGYHAICLEFLNDTIPRDEVFTGVSANGSGLSA